MKTDVYTSSAVLDDQAATIDQQRTATELMPGEVIIADAHASERDIVERLARRGRWTSRSLDRTDVFIAYEHAESGATIRARYCPDGAIEVAEFSKTSSDRPRYAHCLMAVLSFLREPTPAGGPR
ncbi:hypothetical protein [Mycobacterium sp. 29Ha]|uniref:hypothetical protein n=1 Tax=Mycobacterium sp. 29Ha TaxID=2939268 RepID=UPI0029394B5D|nr:hypothetical protein [Mycobacterium sp. 29Ha]MDV3133334.1 hypothetical protein [Mycobacterium sp. 29Ha]